MATAHRGMLIFGRSCSPCSYWCWSRVVCMDKRREFKFEPREDITVYELALILQAHVIPNLAFEKFVFRLPVHVQRHFVELEQNDAD